MRFLSVLSTAAILLAVSVLGVAQQPAPAEEDLVALIHEIAELRTDLADMENRILDEGSEDLLEDEIRNLEFERRIQALGGRLLEIEERFLADDKPSLLEEALVAPPTVESQRATLELLRIEELIALTKGELAAAWHESSLIQQKLTLELKRTITETLTNEPPVACFTPSTDSPESGESVLFVDCSTDPDSEITKWHWDFEDGTTSEEEIPTHSFPEPGTYRVTLEVTDDKGATSTVSRVITVLSTPGPLQVVLSDEAQAQRGRLPRDLLLGRDLASSMEQAFESATKIDVAKDVIREVLEKLPGEASVGLRTFHRCGQSELEIPIQPLASGPILATLQGLDTYGTTPLAYTLRQIPGDLAGLEGPHLIIFITDGIETCGEDPVAAATELAASGFDIVFRLVGYNVLQQSGQKAFDQLQAISDAAGGLFTDVQSRDELLATLGLALPLSYRVFDASGAMVKEGSVGDAPLSLPAGLYSVVVEADPQLIINEVAIGPNEQVTITVSPE